MYFGHDSHINALPNVIQDHLIAHYEFGTYGSSINFVPDLSGWGRHLDVRNANLPAAGTIGLAGNGSSVYALSEAMSHSSSYGTVLNSRQVVDPTYGQYMNTWTIQCCFKWANASHAALNQCLFFLSLDPSFTGQASMFDAIALYASKTGVGAGKLTAKLRSYSGIPLYSPPDPHGLGGPVYGVNSNAFIPSAGTAETPTYYVAMTYDMQNLVMTLGDAPTTYPSIGYNNGAFILNYVQFLRGWAYANTSFPYANDYPDPAAGGFTDYSRATMLTWTMYDRVLTSAELIANKNHYKRRLGVSTFPNGGA